MRGKYSPTVTAAYQKDQKWFINYCFHDINSSEYAEYDPEGYDGYGYNKDNVDRAGNDEFDYLHNDLLDEDFHTNEDYNWRYESALGAWGFDGTKPVKK